MTALPRTVTSTRATAAAPTRRRDIEVQRVRSRAVQRAYARRAQRTGMRRGAPDGVDAAHRAPFVLLVMVVLAVVLVATLWLSTAAAADSYHLRSAQERARNLTERSENLAREVAALETAPELARRARELGMVPAGDAARLLVRPDGAVTLIGQPRRATAPAQLPAPAQPPAPEPAQLPAPAQPPVPAPAQPPAPEPAQPSAPTPPGGT